MIDSPTVTFVGEVNPYGTDPRYALYCEPPHSAGGRLRRLLGLSRANYLHGTARLNLCAGAWQAKEARIHAQVIRREARPVVVLLGRRVAEAFRFGDSPAFSRLDRPGGDATTYIFLPHPSGRCREWNAPSARSRAIDLLRAEVPGVPWGLEEVG